MGCERVRVVVSEGKALLRDAYRFRLYAERCRAARCGTQTRIPERVSSPCIAAYGQPENTVALGFVEGLNNTCPLPPLPRDHHA